MMKKIIKFISKPKENYPNWLILKYHILKTINKIKNGKKNINKDDMFNWKLYNLHYRGEIRESLKSFTSSLKKNDYELVDNKLIKINKEIKPLHPNHQLIYETIMQLKPKSVFEMGCGNGMHLHNLSALSPQLNLNGLDRSMEQINFLKESYPNLNAKIIQADATETLQEGQFPICDLGFTQAVIMHIHKNDLHIKAMENLFKISKKYIIFSEKWKNHKMMEEIKELHKQKKINWENVYFYYRVSNNNEASIMICSSEPLNYPRLDNYETLLTLK